MTRSPLVGVGPAHFPLIAHEFGFTRGKAAHTTWLLYGAELGVPGMVLILAFYGLCVVRLWPYTRIRGPGPRPLVRGAARMTIACLAGFAVAAQFLPATAWSCRSTWRSSGRGS